MLPEIKQYLTTAPRFPTSPRSASVLYPFHGKFQAELVKFATGFLGLLVP